MEQLAVQIDMVVLCGFRHSNLRTILLRLVMLMQQITLTLRGVQLV